MIIPHRRSDLQLAARLSAKHHCAAVQFDLILAAQQHLRKQGKIRSPHSIPVRKQRKVVYLQEKR
jgi:hypothetical protein